MTCCSSGIYGARLGVYPLSDNFIERILNAVKTSDKRNLAVLTDDLGTTIQGGRRRVFDYLNELIGRAFEPEGHTIANLLLSFGCQGDVPEKIPRDTEEKISPELGKWIDQPVSCSWSYYPLGTDSHLDIIEKAISRVVEDKQLTITRAHYCTRLDGPLGTMLNSLEEAFEISVQAGLHTVFHLTLSKGSPSVPHQKIQF